MFNEISTPTIHAPIKLLVKQILQLPHPDDKYCLSLKFEQYHKVFKFSYWEFTFLTKFKNSDSRLKYSSDLDLKSYILQNKSNNF